MFPQDPRTEALPARPLDRRLLRALFLDLLGRPPLRAELERWLGAGLDELLDDVLGSLELRRHWLDEELYFFLLIDNFRPGSERVRAIPEELHEGRLDVRQALHRIALSPSFDLRNPGADTFVTVVMEQICGLRVQRMARELEIGKRIYDGGAGVFLGERGSSQSDIVRIAIESRAAARTFVAREYERYVHVGPPEKELAAWSRAFHRDPRVYLELLRGWLSSDAYRERLARPIPHSNRLFVRSIFVDLLDRPPSAEESEPLREALDGLSDSGPLRSILVRLMLDSGRATLPERAAIDDRPEFVRALFLRLLRRGPRASELATFVAALDDPTCRTETVVLAIVSHPEYQRY